MLLLLLMMMMPRARVLLLLLAFAVVALGRLRRPAAGAGGVLLLVRDDEVVVRRHRLPLHHRLVALVRIVPLPREGGRAPRRRRGGVGAQLRDDLAEELEPAGRGGHLDVGQHLVLLRQSKETPVKGSASSS